MIGRLVKLAILSQFLVCVTQGQSINEESQLWIKDNVYAVSNLNPSNEDFDEFTSLGEAIGNRNVVLLGEQTHGDGTTFEAKVRLIKYLHQELGFDTLVFESDFYSSHKLWQELNKAKDYNEIIPMGIHERWATVQQIQPIFSYIQENLNRHFPLQISGMDILFSEPYAKQSLISDLDSFMKQNFTTIIKSEDYIFFKKEMQRLLVDLQYFPRDETQIKFMKLLDDYTNRLRRIPSENSWNTHAFWAQVLESFKANIKNTFSRLEGTYSPSVFFNRRERLMAENINWILKEDKKIIIWSSVTHNMRDVEKSLLQQMGWPTDTKFMGEYLKELTGPDTMFHITFTGYEGFYTDIYEQKVIKFPTPSPGSVEAVLNDMGIKLGYLILTGSDVPISLTTPFKASFVFNKEYISRWTNSIDAIFFTQKVANSIKE